MCFITFVLTCILFWRMCLGPLWRKGQKNIKTICFNRIMWKMREVKEWKLLVHFHRSRVQLLPEELEGFQEPWCKKNILNNIWETTTCLIFCKPFKKANGLLLFLDPFPTRPLLLFPLHATFPPSDLLKQMISHQNNITLCSTKLYQWYLSSSKWYQIGPQLFFHHYTSHQYK